MQIRNLKFKSAKSGGNQEGGALCGVYTGEVEGQSRTFLAKKEPTPGKNACELAASIIANSLHQYVVDIRKSRGDEEKDPGQYRSERFAVVKPISPNELADAREIKTSEEKETYVASLFASPYSKDFWEFAYDQYLQNDEHFKKQRRGNKHGALQKPVKRPQFLGTGEPKTVFDTVMGEIVQTNPHFLQEFSDARAVNFVIGNLDNHFGNLVISHEKCDNCDRCVVGKSCSLPPLENIHLHSIDFAGAFDPAYTKFNVLVSPLRKGVSDPQPTNHNDEYSRKWRITEEMAVACDDYSEVIREKGNEICDTTAKAVVMNFGLDEIQHYLLRIMDKKDQLPDLRELDDAVKKDFLKDKIAACLRNDFEKRVIPQCEQEAFEVRLSLCFEPKQAKHPEFGFQVNLPRLLQFFRSQEPKGLKKRIREASFRMIGQEDYLEDLRKIASDILVDARALNPSFQVEEQKDFSIQQKIAIDWFQKKNAQRNTHSPVSLEKRLRNAIFDIYELSPTSSSWARVKKVLGWPAAGTIKYLPLKILHFIVFLPRTFLKLGYELLPELGAQFFGWMRDRGLDYLQDKSKKPFASPGDFLNHIIAGLGVLVGGIASPAFKAVRLVGMRVASPVRSVKEAYNFGFKWGNKIGKPVGYFFGSMAALGSMAVSAVGMMATAIVVMPYILAGLSAIGLGVPAAWIAAKASIVMGLPGVLSINGFIGSAANSIGLMTSALAVMSGLTAPLGPLVKGLWNGIKNKVRKKYSNDMTISRLSSRNNECSNNVASRLLTPTSPNKKIARVQDDSFSVPAADFAEVKAVGRNSVFASSSVGRSIDIPKPKVQRSSKKGYSASI